MIPVPRQFRLWGAVGAFFAAVFALWMFFFSSLIPSHFAWVVEPRLAQAFIGAGYVFRTFFFLLFVFERDWRKLRWTPWGNLVFTATLLLATIWHAEEVNWRFLVAHLWVILYTLEPVSMFFLIPRRRAAKGEPLTTGGPLGTWLRRLLIFEVAALGLFGLFLVISPAWLDLRWPWALTQFDARIIAAWFLGWAVWAGSMALASDWDEDSARRPAQYPLRVRCVRHAHRLPGPVRLLAHADAVLRGECDPGDRADGLLLLASGASTTQLNHGSRPSA